jgi:hypothetical protein
LDGVNLGGGREGGKKDQREDESDAKTRNLQVHLLRLLVGDEFPFSGRQFTQRQLWRQSADGLWDPVDPERM